VRWSSTPRRSASPSPRTWTSATCAGCSPPDQPELNLLLEVPGPPFVDADAAEQLKTLTAKGMMGTVIFAVDDCRARHDEPTGQAPRRP
jgi:hypothetical protein